MTIGTLLADTVNAREVLITSVSLAIVVVVFSLALAFLVWLVRLVVRRRRPLRALIASPWVWAAAGVLICVTVTESGADLDDEQAMVAAIQAGDWTAAALGNYVLAYETYVRVIEQGGDRGLDLADRRLERGEDEAEAALRSIARVYRSREPEDIAEHVDWEYMRRVFREKGLTRPPTA